MVPDAGAVNASWSYLVPVTGRTFIKLERTAVVRYLFKCTCFLLMKPKCQNANEVIAQHVL